MTRFVVSLVAGILVVAGSWLGWTRPDDVAAATARPVDRVVAPEGAPIGMGREVSGHGSRTDSTDPADPPSATSSTTDVSRGDRTRPSATSGASARSDDGVRTRAAGDPTRSTTPLSAEGSDVGRSCDRPGPTDSAGMNALLAGLDDQPTLEGADHGGSVALADGRRMFVFGDTIRDTDVIEPFMVRNSVLIANGGCLTPMRVEGGGAAIPDSGGLGHWPMSLRADAVAGGTRVQVVTASVRGLGQGAFETVGSGLATFEVPTGRMPRLVSHVPITPQTDDPRVPTWGAAMWDEGGHTYVFGTASNEGKTTAGWSLHVARAPRGQLSGMDGWEFWDGRRWVSGDPAAAQGDDAALVPAEQGVSHVLGVVRRGGSWYAVSKEGDYHGTHLTVWKAPSVTGPWTRHRVGSLANDSRIRRYTPLVHPDFRTSSGNLLISWSESPTTSGPYFTTPSLYRPRFGELALP